MAVRAEHGDVGGDAFFGSRRDRRVVHRGDLDSRVHGVLRHQPVRRPLASSHGHDAVALIRNDVVARNVLRAFLPIYRGAVNFRRLRQRPDPTPRAHDVFLSRRRGEVRGDSLQYEPHLRFRRPREQRDGRELVGGPRQDAAQPGEHEHDAAVLRFRDDQAARLGREVRGEHDVRSPRGGHDFLPLNIHHAAHEVRERAGRVHHGARAHGERRASRFSRVAHHRADDPFRAAFTKRLFFRSIRDVRVVRR
mmetsp:Transcript_6348/g.25731  ORF Transcript_6348/g.25731 Transcript_6348/m.25731 type:complete len:250 (+) Transcript_6348:459-1208(+)